ncbi:MARVEL domain-containing protein 3 isoform X1 [Spea bombifrons]|uniref:MARVEL domain-containing protein 3 isoform X1 n=1 Tax=Spea bombifrons TaxID=233779 RepID=UPI00234B67F1|nr:MARVEL domain-containing protein 3 isoform X1 [Spea bombifrons]
MIDSAPYQSDGESRAPRKHRSHPRSDQSGNHDYNPKVQSGHRPDRDYGHNERANGRNQPERSRHRERDQYNDERGQVSHKEGSRTRYQDRDRYSADRDPDRTQNQRSRDPYDKREQHSRDREQSKNREDRTPARYEERGRSHMEREQYPSREERSRENHQERDWPQRHYSNDRPHDHETHISDQEPYYKAERSFAPNGSQMNDVEYYESSSYGGILDCHKCRYLCTGRACCQMVEVLLNMLILICSSVSFNSTGGFTGITNLGGIYYYQFGGAYSGFSGEDGEKAQTLDKQFYQLKLPTVRASMAFGGALMAFCCLLVLLGVLRVPWRFPVWLLVECVLDILIALGYIPALYFYFTHLHEAYNSQVCKDRESLYSSKGYQGFTCGLHGADIAAGLFACMAIIAFIASAVLAIKGFLRVRQLKKKPKSTFDL